MTPDGPLVSSADFERRVVHAVAVSSLPVEDETSGDVSDFLVVVELQHRLQDERPVLVHLHRRSVGEELEHGREVAERAGQKILTSTSRNVLFFVADGRAN